MSATYVRMLRLFSRDLRLFLVTAVLVGLAWDGVRAVLFNLYLLRLGYGPESVGVVNSAGALVFGLVCPLAGAMGTRWGSRQVLIVGMGVLAAGFGLLPVVEYLPEAWRMAWLLATSMLTYLGFALYLVNGLPFLMAVTGVEERNYAFSVHMALAPLAAFAGSLLGGWLPGILARGLGLSLAEAAPYRYPLLLAAVLLVPGVLVMLPTRSGDGPPVPRLTGQELEGRASSIPWGLLVIIGLIMALRFGGRGTVTTFFNVYMDEGLGVPTALIGILSAAGQLLSVPAALAAPLLVVRWGNPRIVSWGMIGMALLLLPLALVPQWAAAGLGFVSSTALFSVTVGPIRVFSQELVAPRWRASMASAFMMGAGLAFSMVSLAGGYAIVALGYRAVFLAAAGLAAAGGLLFFAYFHVPRGEISPPSPLNIVE
ncbi:MAG: MFS transporter [Anaerolineae bacterium]